MRWTVFKSQLCGFAAQKYPTKLQLKNCRLARRYVQIGRATLELKDLLSIIISFVALIVSLAALLIPYWHKSSKAIICLNSRLFNCINGQKRELQYTFANIGNQELYVKEICLLRGKSPLGNLHHPSEYLQIPIEEISSFIVKPGEIKPFLLSHEANYKLPEGYFTEKNKYILVCIEVISATGKRFQAVHNISNLQPAGHPIDDPIWSGFKLGKQLKANTYKSLQHQSLRSLDSI